MDVISFSAVNEAVTDDLLDGNAMLAWKNLVVKYKSKINATKMQLKQEFAQSSLDKTKKYPDEWITVLKCLQQRLKTMRHIISDEDLIMHILNNLPDEYKSLVEQMEMILGTSLMLKIPRDKI